MFLPGYRSLTKEEVAERMQEFIAYANDHDLQGKDREDYLSLMEETVKKEWIEVNPKTDITIL